VSYRCAWYRSTSACEALQGAVDRLHDVLARQSGVVGTLGPVGSTLGEDLERLAPLPPERRRVRLGDGVRVRVGRVERRDAASSAAVRTGSPCRCRPATVGQPVAVADSTRLEAESRGNGTHACTFFAASAVGSSTSASSARRPRTPLRRPRRTRPRRRTRSSSASSSPSSGASATSSTGSAGTVRSARPRPRLGERVPIDEPPSVASICRSS